MHPLPDALAPVLACHALNRVRNTDSFRIPIRIFWHGSYLTTSGTSRSSHDQERAQGPGPGMLRAGHQMQCSVSAWPFSKSAWHWDFSVSRDIPAGFECSA
jgi:hypothetical protein